MPQLSLFPTAGGALARGAALGMTLGLAGASAFAGDAPIRSNQFTTGRSGGDPAKPTLQVTRGVARTPGKVRRNPLAVDAPPKLRRFSVPDGRPKRSFGVDTEPQRPADHLRLSESPLPRAAVDVRPADRLPAELVRPGQHPSVTAADRYGMTAVDQLGDFLPGGGPTPDALASSNPTAKALIESDALSAVAGPTPADDLSGDAFQLPNGVASGPAENAAEKVSALPKLPSPYRIDGDQAQPRDVDELLADAPSPPADAPDGGKPDADAKPLHQRIAAWAKSIGGTKPPAERQSKPGFFQRLFR